MNANNISEGINRLKNRIDEALNRSASATLNSHRGLSATLDAAPQQTETYKTASHYTNEADLYRSVQNYQVKSIHGFEPSYVPVQNHYQGFYPVQSYAQPLIIPYGHQYPVQEVRSATYGYESLHLGSPTHFYQPLEYVDDYEGRLSQRNQSSGKKKTLKGKKEEIQNDDDSFSKDPKKTQQSNNVAPKNQAAQQNEAPKQSQPVQQNQQQSQPPQQNQSAQQNQPPQQNQQQNQPPKQNQPPQQNQQNGLVQKNQQPAVDKSNLVLLPKKPYLIDTYNFGQEKRRGGSQRI